MVETGVIHGKFQVMHLGHMEYILAAKMRCKRLIIGISDPDPEHVRFNRQKPGSMDAKAHPLTYFERMEMLTGALLEFGVPRGEFEIVPFPIDDPPLLSSYVPMDAVFYMTVYDDWDLEKKTILEGLGCKVEVLWQRKPEDKKVSGGAVLRSICEEGDWKGMVPKSVYRYICDHGLEEKIRALGRQEVPEEESKTEQ